MIIFSPLSISNPSFHIRQNTICQTNSTHSHNLRQLIEPQSVSKAKNLYWDSRKKGTQFDVVLESMLIDALMKAGFFKDAFRMFGEMREKNVITYTSMIRGCIKNGNAKFGLFLFVEMAENGLIPNEYAVCSTLQACAGMKDAIFVDQLISLLIRLGLENDRIRICLIEFYSKCGLMREAAMMFARMSEVNVVSFTCLMSGFIKNKMFDLAIKLFDEMVGQGIEPNEHTITTILPACGFFLGEQIHAYMIKTMIDKSVYSSSALIELYSNYELKKAELVFKNLDDKNVVTWSSMISCLINNDKVEDAFELFNIMLCECITPNEFTFAIVIGACGLSSSYIQFGKQLHSLVIKESLSSNTRVSNSLITMYSRIGETKEFEKLFEKSDHRDVASYIATISGYFQNGFNEQAIILLSQMHKYGYIPNEYGLSSALSSCANLALLNQGRQLHCLALKSGCDLNVNVGNAVVNMYGKCGYLLDAKIAFDMMTSHDIMSWNSLIHSCAYHGHAQKAIEVFDEMKSQNFSPNHSTFLAILVACNHMGYVNEAIEYFKDMEKLYKIVPTSAHYTCIVDMIGRAGMLYVALGIIEEMPYEKDILIWKSFLGSCRLHRNLELGKLAAQKVLELSPLDSASYVLLSNLHAMHGEWKDVEKVRMMMEKRGVKKDAGWSWIEVKSEVHIFTAGGNSHSEFEVIYQRLAELSEMIKCKDFTVGNFECAYVKEWFYRYCSDD